MTSDFLLKAMQMRRQQSKIFDVPRQKTKKILYPAKISSKIKGEMKTFFKYKSWGKKKKPLSVNLHY